MTEDSREEKCWFCKKNYSSVVSSLVLPFYRVIRRTDTPITSGPGELTLQETRFEKESITIPRCVSCASMHKTEPEKIRSLKNKWQAICSLISLAIATGAGGLVITTLKWEDMSIVWLSFCCLLPFVLATVVLTPIFVESSYWSSKGIKPESQRRIHPDVQRAKKSGWIEGEKPS
jgi:hypothetical protein